MFNLAERNLKIFFRQKSSVFFSLLGIIIIIGLYVLFLGDVWLSDMSNIVEAANLLNNWIMAGIISVASITTAMGAFGVMVDDRTRNISKDFYSAPIKKSQIVGGYILSAFVVGVVMSLIAFLLGEIYIVIEGGSVLPICSILKVLGIIVISVLSSSSLVFFIVSFISSIGAFTTASTVIGSLIGFLTGIYLPIGMLPETVQWIIKLFPVSHAGALLRQVMMEQSMAISFDGISEIHLSNFRELMGITFTYGDYTISAAVHIFILIGVTVLFYILALLNISRK